jgi:hypothetical protein
MILPLLAFLFINKLIYRILFNIKSNNFEEYNLNHLR